MTFFEKNFFGDSYVNALKKKILDIKIYYNCNNCINSIYYNDIILEIENAAKSDMNTNNATKEALYDIKKKLSAQITEFEGFNSIKNCDQSTTNGITNGINNGINYDWCYYDWFYSKKEKIKNEIIKNFSKFITDDNFFEKNDTDIFNLVKKAEEVYKTKFTNEEDANEQMSEDVIILSYFKNTLGKTILDEADEAILKKNNSNVIKYVNKLIEDKVNSLIFDSLYEKNIIKYQNLIKYINFIINNFDDIKKLFVKHKDKLNINNDNNDNKKYILQLFETELQECLTKKSAEGGRKKRTRKHNKSRSRNGEKTKFRCRKKSRRSHHKR